MATGDAKNFIHSLMQDSTLRAEFIGINTKAELEVFYKEHDFDFYPGEFEHGFTDLLMNCQFESLAGLYRQIEYVYQTVISEIR